MSQKSKIADQKLALRAQLWPDITAEHLWERTKSTGFTTLPRTMPLLATIMDSLSKNKPVSAVYLDLWCRAFDECFVTLNKQPEMAFHAGFTGQRAVQTWSERIKILHKWGFINVVAGPSGPLSFAVILNPYKIIKRLSKDKPSPIRQDLLNALHQRVIEIGAEDFKDG
ncbi:MAG: hypothetical protein JWO08_3482 [Verrucomicrobiaceae bacterium]|nr:hypothetical protein [Verrucomicrobiaceae bacterium]